MISSISKLACFVLLAQQGFAATISVRSAPELSTRAISPLFYEGPVTPGGENVTLTGTSAQDIHAQIKHLNRDFQPDTFSALSAQGPNEKRNKDGPPNCNVGVSVVTGKTQENINYLAGLSGRCGVNANSCARIACTWNVAIYLCNDNNAYIAPSCAYLATYASDIMNACPRGGNLANGQLFDTDRYNIIVTGTDMFDQQC